MIFSKDAPVSRVVVGRVHRGRRLQDALAELAAEHRLTAGWFSGLGAFEWVDVTEYCQSTRKYEEAHRFERCELLSMVGNLSIKEGEPFWHLHATVSRREGGQEVVYGGHVVDAQIFALEFRVECLDGVQLMRSLDEPTGLQLWADTNEQSDQGLAGAEPQVAQETSVPSGWAQAASASEEAPSGWAQVAAASAEAEKPETAVEHKPERGDWIDHPKFGLCRVDGLSAAGVGIIRLPDGRRKKIQFSVLRVLAPRQDGQRRIFPVTPKGRG